MDGGGGSLRSSVLWCCCCDCCCRWLNAATAARFGLAFGRAKDSTVKYPPPPSSSFPGDSGTLGIGRFGGGAAGRLCAALERRREDEDGTGAGGGGGDEDQSGYSTSIARSHSNNTPYLTQFPRDTHDQLFSTLNSLFNLIQTALAT
jgi:hypothetical protein